MEAPVNTASVGGASSRLRNAVPFAVTMAAVAAFSFLSGGYILGRSAPIVVAWLVLAAVWVWFLRRRARPPVLLLVALAAFGLFALWSGLSVLWSIGPDLTWVAFNLTAFYLAVVAVLSLTSVRGLQLKTAGYAYLAVAVAVGVYAFLGKAIPNVVTHAHTYARLDSPVGYWNVLALMMIMGLCVALSVAGDRRAHPALRTLAAALAVPMSFTFFFTFSRGGWIALTVALVLYFAFTTTRLASLWSLLAIVTPVALALWRLRGLETLFTETTDDALRALQGGVLLRWALAALLVTSGAQLVVALVHGAVRWPRWSTIVVGAVVLALAGVVLVGGSARYVQARGGTTWVKDKVHALATDSDTGSAMNGPGRLGSMNTGRPIIWREALEQWRHDRAKGVGDGTFPLTHYRFRSAYGGVVKHAHSQWFNILSELGTVGLALFVLALLLLVATMIGNPFSHRSDPLHPLLVAMQAGVIAFFVHISWDWDWDMAAIGTLVFAFIAVCASYRATRAADERRHRRRREARAERPVEAGGAADESGETAAAEQPPSAVALAMPADAVESEGVVADEMPVGPAETGDAGPHGAEAPEAQEPDSPDASKASERPHLRRRRVGWGPRVVASAALVLLALSWLPPYLAGRAENAALAAAGDGDVTAALTHARRAARLDPLAISPLLVESTLLEQQGRVREALAKVQAAARLQPDNYEVWYQLGMLLHGALGREKAARAAFKRALALNPSDAGSRYELEQTVH